MAEPVESVEQPRTVEATAELEILPAAGSVRERDGSQQIEALTRGDRSA